MKVHILNYKDGQLIQHSSVLYLKGFISLDKKGDVGFGTLGHSGLFNLSKELEIIQNSNKACNFKFFNTSFISLTELSEGLNTFDFKDKRSNRTIDQFQLNYSPPNLRGHLILPLYILSQNSIKCDDIIIKNKLRLGLQVIQGFFGEKLFEHGFRKKSFRIATDFPKVLTIDLKSERILEMESGSLWEHLVMVLRARDDLWNRQYKYIAFMADPWKLNSEGHHSKLALGGGGLVLIGTDFLKVWPENLSQVLETIFSPESLTDPHLLALASRFGNVGRTVGSLYAASLGSLAHEMGHIFDLGHTQLGLMGSQFHRMETPLSPVLLYPPILQRTSLVRPKIGLPGGETGEDVVSIGHSCATMLYHNRWFAEALIPITTGEDANVEGPELTREKIISRFPLTAIQIREVNDGRLLKDYTFLDNQDKSTIYEFTLAKNHIPMSCKSGEAVVIVQDLHGNILKKNINRDILPQSFTVIQRR